jgi:hypothetical protein
MHQSFKCLLAGITAVLSIIVTSRSSNIFAQTTFRSSDCYQIRSLNNNFTTDKKYLGYREINPRTPQSSEGASVQMVQYDRIPGLTSRKRFWRITNTDKGFILTTFNNSTVNLDGASDGKTTVFHRVGSLSHGQYWQLEPDQGAYRIRSLNNNFRDQNYRWLDGGSDGQTVSLVNGKSHGTLWEIRSMGVCPSSFKSN